MSQRENRVPVLPRAVAARITVSAIARAVWAVAALILLMTIPVMVDHLVRIGRFTDAWLPVILLLLMVGVVTLLARRPSTLKMLAWVIVGGVSVWGYQTVLLGVDPTIAQDARYILNQPALALVLVGTASASALGAVAWSLLGLVSASTAMLAASLQAGLPIPDFAGPGTTFANYAAALLGIALIHRIQSGRIPDVDRLLEETRRLDAERASDQRAVALIHDTVLNDLSLVMNGPAVLDERSRARMRYDMAALMRADWAETPSRDVVTDALGADFRHQVMSVASDFQWRGLSVDVAVDDVAPLRLSPVAATAALGAVRACLENVLRHSGVTTAELILGGSDGLVTVMVVDSGSGFDKDAVPGDRLGLRSSVVRRVESAGGDVRIWSTPGRGTSVLISLPLAAPLAISAPAGPGAGSSGDAGDSGG